MRKTRGPIIKFIICLMCLSFVLTGCSLKGNGKFFDLGFGGKAVFVIGKEVCREPEARVYLANLKNLYGSIGGQSLWSEQGNTVLSKAVKDITMTNLKRVYVYSAYAKANGIALSEEEKNSCKEAASEYYNSLSKADRKYLKTSKKKLQAIYERYLLAQKVYESEIASVDTELSEDECRVITANVIFVTDYATAELINNAIVNKEKTFQLLASTYSQAPSYEVHITRGMYPEEVENVVFALEDAQISGPIAADGGYYFFRCISKYDDELSSEYGEELLMDRKNAALEKVNSYVEDNYKNLVNTSIWESMTVNFDSEITTNSFFLTLSKKML